MKWILCLALAAAACQRGDGSTSKPEPTPAPKAPQAAVTADYRTDIQNLCDAIHLSGAEEVEEAQRWPVIAIWLGKNMKTDDLHKFLVATNALQGEAHAQALEAEAKRVGLNGCALAAEWRKAQL